MAPVVAFVAAVAAKITVAAVVKFVVTTALSIGISRLLAKRAMKKAAAGGDGGGRVQLPPATDNKIPVVYGSAYVGGSIIDAMISENQRTMWYVVALSEVTDVLDSSISFGDVYYDGKLVQFGSNGAVTALINNSTTPNQSDNRVNGNLFIYLYNNGSSSPTNSSLTAQQVLSTANGVPAAQAWGVNNLMSKCAFAIVRVNYNTEAGTTNLGALTVQVKNTEDGLPTGEYRPGSAIYDYMINTRYGCAIPASQVSATSLNALNEYSDQLITYTPVGGGSATQARYRINGPLDTASNCLDNLQYLVDSCDSWLQYSELTGQWKVVMNKAYTQNPDPLTTNDLFIVNSSNLVGGIEISPIDLNETFNQVEVAYPNYNIKDQTDYQIIDLFDTNPSLLSQNEAVNRLNITLPLVNNAVQAKYLAARRIYQSREDLVITFRTDYSGIQVEAGDVVRVYHETYGWDADNGFPDGKLFRISEVIEEKDDQGNLFASFRAFEYNATIYADDPVQDYVPAFNTGLQDPNIIGQPCTPIIYDFGATNALVTAFRVETCVPDTGIVKYIDFNYGVVANVGSHRLYKTISDSDGTPMFNSDSANSAYNFVYCDVNDLPAGTYYWSAVARNDTQKGRSSASSSSPYVWNGANIQPYNPISNTGGVTGNQIQYNTIVNNNISNYTITGGKISNNTLVLNNFNTDLSIQKTISLGYCEIMDTFGNIYTAPEDVTTRTTISGTYIPSFYIIGTDPGTNYVFPIYQNTATTANGYAVNSSGIFQPGRVSGTARFNGDYDWYVILRNDFTSSIGAGEYLQSRIDAQFVSDVDATIQIYNAVVFSGANTVYIGNDTFIDTIHLKANAAVNFETFRTSVGTASMIASAWMIRNITANANVVCTVAKTGDYAGYGNAI